MAAILVGRSGFWEIESSEIMGVDLTYVCQLNILCLYDNEEMQAPYHMIFCFICISTQQSMRRMG